MQKYVFMPNLLAISFKNCTFIDSKRAGDFADALARRQEILKETSSLPGIERLSFIGKENEASKVFCSRLRQAKQLEDVDIQVAEN
ncbi:hypothetical protein M408DRAFT_284310 [Serendipita vermifera MAFF 305830]|uniref:Uncharacterized protein n=1 Tax=Serendipita vermifera MAFF 305830 TaxID=933852 RepID=A0A0C3ACT5_SERVB|nr:hypothetical protein M408DRAFT_284310 [Serendipita vermifera MAFF 305830]